MLRAVCILGPNGVPCSGTEEAGKAVSGTVSFECSSESCTINYRVEGLAPGNHGFHIHEKADFSNGCVSAGIIIVTTTY